MRTVFATIVCTAALASLGMPPRPANAAGPGVEAIAIEGPLGWATTLKDGRLMAWYTEGKKLEDAQRADMPQKAFARYSSDGGRTWTAPELLFEFPLETGCYAAQAILCDRDGVIHLIGLHWFGVDWEHPDNWDAWKDLVWHVMSSDGGKTWTKPQYCDFRYRYCGGVNWMFQHSSGRILAPLSAYSKRKTARFVVLMTLSDDGGKTWRPSKGEIVIETGSGAEESPESGADEPVAVELSDGRIWMSIRTQGGYQYASYSSDRGDTWTKPVPSRFVSSNSTAAVLRLRDGRLVYVWSNAMGPRGNRYDRQILAAAISADDGKTWKGYREIARINALEEPGEPRQQLSYHYLTQAADGALVVNISTWSPGRITRVDPDWLTEPAFHEDFAKGLANWATLGAEGVTAAPHPDRAGRQVLWLQKPKADVPAGASLNFPFGAQGRLTTRLRLEPGFQGAYLSLTDYFSLLGDRMDGRFELRIAADGTLEAATEPGRFAPTGAKLQPGKWHTLGLAWDCGKGTCALSVDYAKVTDLRQITPAPGVCYLRLQSTAETTDEAGLMVESVDTRAVGW
jgi:hypothetical protein